MKKNKQPKEIKFKKKIIKVLNNIEIVQRKVKVVKQQDLNKIAQNLTKLNKKYGKSDEKETRSK